MDYPTDGNGSPGYENFTKLYNKILLKEDIANPDSYLDIVSTGLEQSRMTCDSFKAILGGNTESEKFIKEYKEKIDMDNISDFCKETIYEYEFLTESYVKNIKITIANVEKLTQLIEKYDKKSSIEEKQNFVLSFRKRTLDFNTHVSTCTMQQAKLIYLQTLLTLIEEEPNLIERNKI